MASAINVSVDDALKEQVTALYADLGLSVQDAIRIFLRRSLMAKGLPFPMERKSQMEEADEEIRQFLKTGKGLKVYDTPEEAMHALELL